MPDFAKILRKVRKNYNLTQEAAAEAFSISHATLQRIEAGRRDLTYPELERIAEYCRKDIDEIIQLDAEPEGPTTQPILPEKEERLEKIIVAQNEQITSLLVEIRNLYGVVKKLISGGNGM